MFLTFCWGQVSSPKCCRQSWLEKHSLPSPTADFLTSQACTDAAATLIGKIHRRLIKSIFKTTRGNEPYPRCNSKLNDGIVSTSITDKGRDEWMDCSLAASSGAWEGLAACGHKPAFQLWLRTRWQCYQQAEVPQASPSERWHCLKTERNSLHPRQGSAAPPISDANEYKHGYRAEQKRWCVDQPWHRLGSN